MFFVAATAGGAWLFVESGAIESTDNAYLRADAAIASPRIEGYLSRIMVHENQRISGGDILIELDDRNYRARVAQAAAERDARRAQVAADRAALESLIPQRALQDSVIEQSKASLAVAAAEAERAKLDYDRYKSLKETAVSSVQRFETATSVHLKADAEHLRGKAALQAEQRRLPLLDNEQRKAEARLKQSEAELRRAEAALALAKNDLDDCRLRAPFDGIVGNLSARVGEFVRPGTALLTVVPTKAYVVANFKETQVAKMRPGQPVSISVDAYTGLHLKGRVDSIAPATGSEFSILPPENATGNFTKIVQRVPVRIAVTNPAATPRQLRAGLSVFVSVNTADPGCENQSSCDGGTQIAKGSTASAATGGKSP
jgi:membrane fusion protein, multidrug efflux system